MDVGVGVGDEDAVVGVRLGSTDAPESQADIPKTILTNNAYKTIRVFIILPSFLIDLAISIARDEEGCIYQKVYWGVYFRI